MQTIKRHWSSENFNQKVDHKIFKPVTLTLNLKVMDSDVGSV